MILRRFSSQRSLQAANLFQRDVGALTIQGVGSNSISFSDESSARGPVMILNNSVLLANLPQYGLSKEAILSDGSLFSHANEPSSVFHRWTPNMLAPITLVDPPPEILVIGSGARMHRLPDILRKFLLENGVQIEVQQTVPRQCTKFLVFRRCNVQCSSRRGQTCCRLVSSGDTYRPKIR